MNRLHYYLGWIGVLLGMGCRGPSGPEVPAGPSSPAPYSGPGFFICNEGNFRWGNASLSFYSEAHDTVYNGIFEAANGRPLGDVAQSMAIIQGKGYLVVNNSGKVEVVNPLTAQSEGTIRGLVSPRYVVPTGDGRAYISDLYARGIAVVDLTDHRLVDTLPYPDWTEYWVSTPDGIIGCGVKKGTVFRIDPTTDRIVAERKLRPEVAGMVLDRWGALWVLCNGGFSEVLPALYRLRLPDLTPVDSFLFPDLAARPGRLSITPRGDTLIFINRDVYVMDISASALPHRPYVRAGKRLFYHVQSHPRKPWLVITDARDYVQEGQVLIVERTPSGGRLLDSFNVGIIPGHITFVP